MASSEYFRTGFVTGEAFTTPTPDNDNWVLSWDWMTPAETLQLIRRWKREISRQLSADSRLWNCPEHRLTRNIRYAMEQCALWQYYKVRRSL